MEVDLNKYAAMLKHYESMKRASAKYYEKKRQEKIEAGTY